VKTIEFPANRSIGYVHFQQSDVPASFHGRFNLDGSLLPDTFNPIWQLIGAAQGIVELPQHGVVMLEVMPEEARDLSPLSSFAPNDLDAIWLGNTYASDDQLIHLAHLTGLLWIDLQNNGNITDAGVAHLRGLKSLRSFGAHWTRISALTMEYLAEMPELTYIDIWGCEIPTQAVDEFKIKLPKCEVRTE